MDLSHPFPGTDPATAKLAYEARIYANYPANSCFALLNGLFGYAAMGFISYESVMAVLIYDLSRSDLLVGLLGTTSSIAFILAQLYGMSRFEPLRERKGPLLQYGFFNRITRLLMAVSLLFLPPSLTLFVIFFLFFAGEFFVGLYLLLFFDVMAKVIPLRERGRFFGLRNSLSLLVQAGAGYLAGLLVGRYSYLGGDLYRSPLGYALCFLIAFGANLVDIGMLSRLKEEPSLTVGEAMPLLTKLRSLPALFRRDRSFVWYCLLRGVCLLAFTTLPFVMVYAKNRITVTGEVLGAITAVRMLALAGGTYLAGRLANRYGFKRLLEGSTLAFALSLFLAPLLGSFQSFLVYTAGTGLVLGAIALSVDNLQMEFGTPASRPTYIAIATVSSGLLMGTFSPLVGVIAARFSYNGMFALVGLVMLTAAFFLHRKVTDPRHVPEYHV